MDFAPNLRLTAQDVPGADFIAAPPVSISTEARAAPVIEDLSLVRDPPETQTLFSAPFPSEGARLTGIGDSSYCIIPGTTESDPDVMLRLASNGDWHTYKFPVPDQSIGARTVDAQGVTTINLGHRIIKLPNFTHSITALVTDGTYLWTLRLLGEVSTEVFPTLVCVSLADASRQPAMDISIAGDEFDAPFNLQPTDHLALAATTGNVWLARQITPLGTQPTMMCRAWNLSTRSRAPSLDLEVDSFDAQEAGPYGGMYSDGARMWTGTGIYRAYDIATGAKTPSLDFAVRGWVSRGSGVSSRHRYQYGPESWGVLLTSIHNGKTWSYIPSEIQWVDFSDPDGDPSSAPVVGNLRIVTLPELGSADANKDAHISTTITQDELNNALYGVEVERRRAGSEDWETVSDIRSRAYDASTRKLTITTDADQRDDADTIQPELWQFRFKLKGFVHTPEVGPDYNVLDSNQLTAFAPAHLPPIEHVPDD